MIQALFDEYVALRSRGADANSALEPLRPRIAKLSEIERAELVRRVRDWEKTRQTGRQAPPAAPEPPPPPAGIKRIAPIKPLGAVPPPEPPPVPPVRSVAPPASSKTIECPKCHRVSPASEILCPTCGTFLQQDTGSAFQTNRFDVDTDPFSPDFFGTTSTLVLYVRHNKNQYRIQPQTFGREIIIGRSDGSAPVTPDIDLANQEAGMLGVSRMHLSLHYDAAHNTLSATDLRSANGSFVNNQRLHPHEVRVLRSGDELRLGKLVLGIIFQHQ